jgi:hypothetical protein
MAGTQPGPEQWAEAYVIEFTEREVALLTTERELMPPLDRQRAFLLTMALRPEQCPACKFVLCPRSAWKGSQPFDPAVNGDGPDYECPACGARLEHWSGLTMSEHGMALAPGQTVTIHGAGEM